MQTRQIFITFRTFIGQKNKRNPTLNLFYGGDRSPPSVISMYGAGFKTHEVKVRSPARKSRTRETDRPVGTHALPPPMPYSSSEESPTSAVSGV